MSRGPSAEISERRIVLWCCALAVVFATIPMGAGVILGLLARHAHVGDTLLK